MKKGVFVIGFILSLALFGIVSGSNTTLVHAGSSSRGAIIQGIETDSEYGHVLDYYNTNEVLERTNYISYVNDWPAGSYKYYTMVPDSGNQLIKAGTLRLETYMGAADASVAEIFSAYGVKLNLYVTFDGLSFTDVTDTLNADGFYENPADLKGYYIEYLMANNVVISQEIELYITHEIVINYDGLSLAQKSGAEGLESWLDSKGSNLAPTENYQKIFVVNPEISGTVKYQQLTDSSILPTWAAATTIAGIPVQLTNGDGTIIASTTTDADGKFVFSNVLDDATRFQLVHSSEKLYIVVDGQGKEQWQITGNSTINTTNSLSLGTIVDISKSQSAFNLAKSRTTWTQGFTGHDLNGAHALGSQFILTDLASTSSSSTITVHHLDEDGNILADATTFHGNINDLYETAELAIPGYEFATMHPDSAPISGEFLNQHQDIIFVYKKIADKPNPGPVPPATVSPKPVLPTTGAGYQEILSTGVLVLFIGAVLVIYVNRRN